MVVRKSGFTLVEVLVALVIVGILVGTAVVSFGAGVKSAQMADATRAVQQYASHARAIALLKQRPVVLTIEEIEEDGVFVKSRLSTNYAKDDDKAEGAGASGGAGFGVAGNTPNAATTLTGEPVDLLDDAAEPAGEMEADDPLSPEPRDFEGIHIRAQAKEETTQRRSRISVFSTADFLLRKNREQQEKARAKAAEAGGAETATDAAATPIAAVAGEPFSVVYEPNGRCDPYEVKIWKDGTDETKAVTMEVSRFGRVTDDEEER